MIALTANHLILSDASWGFRESLSQRAPSRETLWREEVGTQGDAWSAGYAKRRSTVNVILWHDETLRHAARHSAGSQSTILACQRFLATPISADHHGSSPTHLWI